ncbi:MAG: hypothetical protein OIF35_10895, partial [Cellvibrionaceae bacterium]|nr:hypothetical protein [Cellvibrionaceae bacterium]
MFKTQCFLIALAFNAVISSASAEADKKFDFDIAAGIASEQLQLFAQQTQQALIYPVAQMRELRSQAVVGRMSAIEAITQMLGDSTYRAVLGKGNILTVVAVRQAKLEENSMQFKQKPLAGIVGLLSLVLGGTGQAQESEPSRAQESWRSENQAPVLEEIQVIGTHIEGVQITDTLPVSVLEK